MLGRRAEISAGDAAGPRADEYASVLLAVTDVVHDRTTILVEGHASAVARAFEAPSGQDDAIELPGVYSRKKQIVPLLGRIKELIGRAALAPAPGRRAPRP